MKGHTTKAIHTFYTPNKEDGAIIPPIHLTTTYKMGNGKGYDYSRSNNPTREILEATIASLDGTRFGLAYASGSAALANVLGLLAPNKKILFSTDSYGGTYRLITTMVGKHGGEYVIADL